MGRGGLVRGSAVAGGACAGGCGVVRKVNPQAFVAAMGDIRIAKAVYAFMQRGRKGGDQTMKRGNQRPYWAGFLTGAGVTLLAVYVSKQSALISMNYDLYILIGNVGLVLVFVGAFLHSPLRGP